MNIAVNKEGTKVTLTLEGRIDSSNYQEFENAVKNNTEDINDLVIDFAGVDYISSAGLRVLLLSDKIMSKKGSFVLKNVNEDVDEILDVTGFKDMLTIE